MKKLMVLGGSRYALPIIKKAHEMGVYVITADYLPDNYAHKYSDEYCNVSIVDKEAVLEKARELNIDGITSFACDPGVVTAAYVAEKMGLPSVGSYESVCILQNKGKFRKFLTDNNFNVPTARSYKSIKDALQEAEIYNWPVIVKPVDSAGSKGVTRVDKPEKLRDAINNAILFSNGKEFIIEDFIEKSGYSSDSDSFSIDGELKFVSFNSQMFDEKAENPYTPAAYSWPSELTSENEKELASEVQRLITLLDLKTSIYNIESRVGVDGKAYIMECSPRGGGNRLAECIEYSTGLYLIENVIRAALGVDILPVQQEAYNGYWAEIILHSNNNGIFKELWISDEIKDNLIDKDLWVKVGDEISPFSAANYSIGTLIFRFENKEKLQMVMSNLEKYIKVELRG